MLDEAFEYLEERKVRKKICALTLIQRNIGITLFKTMQHAHAAKHQNRFHEILISYR